MLQPLEEELQTPWYTTLALPLDNEHRILDVIVNRNMNNVAQQQILDNLCAKETTIPCSATTHVSVGVGPSFASSFDDCDYITRKEMEEMLTAHRQHIVSDVTHLCSDLKEQQEVHYHALLENQK